MAPSKPAELSTLQAPAANTTTVNAAANKTTSNFFMLFSLIFMLYLQFAFRFLSGRSGRTALELFCAQPQAAFAA
jgi:hypothetical protein